jgi:hypothetical protein
MVASFPGAGDWTRGGSGAALSSEGASWGLPDISHSSLGFCESGLAAAAAAERRCSSCSSAAASLATKRLRLA